MAPKATSSLSPDIIRRLQDLSLVHRFLPVGHNKPGDDAKGPIVPDWPNHKGFRAEDLFGYRGMRAIGVITKPLICFDFDGRTAFQKALSLDLAPSQTLTWRIDRTTDKYRFKMVFLLDPDQLSDPAASAEISDKLKTKPAVLDEDGKVIQKAEALEVFWHPGRQIIVAGDHVSSGGSYYWPPGQGPESLSNLHGPWLDYFHELIRDYPKPSQRSGGTTHSKGDWRRVSECPICGRSWKDNAACQLHSDGQTLRCFIGSTFAPPTGLRPGQLVPGTDWAFSRESSSGWGEFLVFVKDKPSPVIDIRRWLRDR